MLRRNKHRIIALSLTVSALLLLLLHPLFSNGETRLLSLYNAGLTAETVQSGSSLTNSRTLSAKACFVYGSALYEEDLNSNALLWLKRSLRTGAPWEEASRYRLARSAADAGNVRAALTQYKKLLATATNSPVFEKYLSEAADLTGTHGTPQELVRLLAGTPLTNRPAYALRFAAACRETGAYKEAGKAFIRALYGDFYGKTNSRLLNLYNLLKNHGLKLQPAAMLRLAEAYIRDNRTAAAAALLDTAGRLTAGDPKLHFEHSLNRLWLLRHTRNWQLFQLHLQRLFQQAGTNRSRLFRLHNHAWQAAVSRNHLQTALHHAVKAAHLNRSGAYNMVRRSAGQRPGATALTLQVAAAGMRLYPDAWAFQEMAVYCWLDRYNRQSWTEINRELPALISRLTHPHLRATSRWIHWQTAIRLGKPVSEQQRLQTALVLDEPLGYYHRITGTPAVPAVWHATNTLQHLCKAWLTYRKPPEALSKLILNKWSRSRLHLATRSGFSAAVIATNVIPQSRRALFLDLVEHKLYREAFQEADHYLDMRTAPLSKHPAQVLHHLSLLAARSSYYPMEMQCLRALHRKFGWGRELAVIDRLSGTPVYRRLYPQHFASLVNNYTALNDLDPLLIWALMRQESGFHPTIRSWAGAYGLMQVMPATAMGLAGSLNISKVNLRSPETNIRLGCSLLRWLNKTFKGRPEPILIGYNAGAGRVSSWKRRFIRRYGNFNWPGYVEAIPFRETRYYIKKVLANLSVYQLLYKGDLPQAD